MRFFRKKQAKSDPKAENNMNCSFCYKSHLEVAQLISAPNDIYICGECVEQCVELLERFKEVPTEQLQLGVEFLAQSGTFDVELIRTAFVHSGTGVREALDIERFG